jgi:transcriptional regulator of arginine metabolism
VKIERQSKIIEIIQNNIVETQEDLAQRLKDGGFDVTQATISRDIRELKLTKISTEDGKQKYAIMTGNDQQLAEKFIRVFSDAVTSIDYAQNIVVIKTLQGMAMAVAAAVDAMGNSEIIGCIAGDDTLFCLTKSEPIAISMIEKLNKMTK